MEIWSLSSTAFQFLNNKRSFDIIPSSQKHWSPSKSGAESNHTYFAIGHYLALGQGGPSSWLWSQVCLWLVYIFRKCKSSRIQMHNLSPLNQEISPTAQMRHSDPLRLNSCNAPGLVQSDGDWSERKAAVTVTGLECKSVERSWEVRTHALGQDRLSLHWRQRVMFNHGRLMSCLYSSNCIGHRRRMVSFSLSPSLCFCRSLFIVFLSLCSTTHHLSHKPIYLWVPDVKEHISLVWFLMTWMIVFK